MRHGRLIHFIRAFGPRRPAKDAPTQGTPASPVPVHLAQVRPGTTEIDVTPLDRSRMAIAASVRAPIARVEEDGMWHVLTPAITISATGKIYGAAAQYLDGTLLAVTELVQPVSLLAGDQLILDLTLHDRVVLR